MRQLKFRAWDGKEMTHEVTIYNGSFIDCTSAEEGIFSAWHDPSEQVAIMQFTGLTDRNGAEIYEGDIVEVAKNKRYEVRYSEGATSNHEWFGGTFVLFFNEDLFFPFDEFAMEHGSVIGNIYENPELLNQKP